MSGAARKKGRGPGKDDLAGPGVARFPEDTTPEAHEAQVEAYRRMGGPGRSQVMFRLNEMARQVAMAGIRARHQEYTPEQVRFALHRLLLGDELTRAVWPGRDLVDP